MDDAMNSGRDYVFEELNNASLNGSLDPAELTKRFGAARRVFRESTGNDATNYQGVINNNY